MRLAVLLFVITSSVIIGVAWAADLESGKHYSKEKSSENEVSRSHESSSSQDETQEENSSEDESSSNEDDDSSTKENSSTDENSQEEGIYSTDGSLPTVESRLGKASFSKRTRRLSTPEECARTCVAGESPKTCYYHFTVENYGTLTKACDLCRTISTRITADCQCITADGYELSGIKVVNRMLPGPSIMVCLNDYVVIDVDNRVHGSGVTIHWHGIFQNGYQYYDGVPYVTQCPIQEGTTFRYQWRAKNAGTHFWHSHSGLQKMDGLDGAIIVREPKVNELNNDLWDFDNFDHFIFLNDWFHDSAEAHFPGNYVRNPLHLPDNFLVNGEGQWMDPSTGQNTNSPLARFTVSSGYRYRFRLINSGNLNCPLQMTIQGHNLTIIATDGEPVEPVVVNSITSFSAERYDFVIHAAQSPGNYWIQFRSLGECEPKKLQQLAILHYSSVTYSNPQLQRPTYNASLDAGIVLNQINVRCDGSPKSANVICVSQLRSAKPTPSRILQAEPDVRLFVPFSFYNYAVKEVFKPGTYQSFMVPTASGELVSTIGKNSTYVAPPVSLISQRDEISDAQFCSLEELPSRCNGKPLCPCTVMEEIPLNSVVEIILVDEAHVDGLSHPFHLHGQFFYVMGEGTGNDYNIPSLDVASARILQSNGMFRRRFDKPPAKDTYAVFNNGFSIIRFIADNPGYWFFHCHFGYHLVTGMAAVFHVGEADDLPPVPEGFPQCGNFVPPISNYD